MSLQFQVEVARPDEAQHGARETADESHQDLEVRNEAGHQNRHHDHCHSERKSPDFEVSVQCPNRRHFRLRWSPEEVALQELRRRVVGQRITQHGLDDQEEVDEPLKSWREQVVGDHLLRVVLEGEEAHVAEDCFEGGCCDVRPVQHPVELGPIDHVPFECGQEDLRRVREDDDSEGNGELAHVDAPSHATPAPLGDLQQAVGHDNSVDDQVSHGAPEGQHGHTLQRLE